MMPLQALTGTIISVALLASCSPGMTMSTSIEQLTVRCTPSDTTHAGIDWDMACQTLSQQLAMSGYSFPEADILMSAHGRNGLAIMAHWQEREMGEQTQFSRRYDLMDRDIDMDMIADFSASFVQDFTQELRGRSNSN